MTGQVSLKLLESTTETLSDLRQVKVICSTASVDRAGDIIVQGGIDLGPYKKNPVVLWGHNPNVPIARAVDIGIVGGKLQATVQFPPEGEDDDADWVYGKIKAGVVNATSVGFMPTEYEPLNPKEPWSGYKFNKSELYEFSFVSVPANRDCLIIGRDIFNGSDLPLPPSLGRKTREWTEKDRNDCDTVTIPRQTLVEIFKASHTPHSVRDKYKHLTEPQPADAALLGNEPEKTETPPQEEDMSKSKSGEMPGGNCGRDKDMECGMKDPVECSIHAPETKSIDKAGRRISAKTKSALQKVLDQHQECMKCLKAVIEGEGEDEGDDPEGDDGQGEPGNAEDPAEKCKAETAAFLADLKL